LHGGDQIIRGARVAKLSFDLGDGRFHVPPVEAGPLFLQRRRGVLAVGSNDLL